MLVLNNSKQKVIVFAHTLWQLQPYEGTCRRLTFCPLPLPPIGKLLTTSIIVYSVTWTCTQRAPKVLTPRFGSARRRNVFYRTISIWFFISRVIQVNYAIPELKSKNWNSLLFRKQFKALKIENNFKLIWKICIVFVVFFFFSW